MNERLITLGGALMAALIAVALLMPPRAPAPEASAPTSAERGAHGYSALKRWLDESGVATLSLRQRYTALGHDRRLEDGGNLMITTLPHTTSLQADETAALGAWLQAGNALLVLMALNDLPSWSVQTHSPSDMDLLPALGFHLVEQEYTSGRRGNPFTLKEERTSLLPTVTHPVTAGVEALEVEHNSLTGARRRLVGSDDERSALVLLREAQSAVPALWQVNVEGAAVWLMPYASVFDNAMLGHGDNARLMANLVDIAVAAGGAVVFDDFHHGLSALYDPRAFFGDSRLHATLAFIVAFWLIYLLGHSNRMAPLQQRPSPPRLMAHVCAVRDTLARRLAPAAVGERLLWHFFNDYRREHHLPANGEPVWDELERHAQVDPDDLARLRHSAAAVAQRRRVDLKALNNQIHTIREQWA